MKNIKRIVAVLLAALLVLMSMPAFAAEGSITGDLELFAPPDGKKSAVEYRLKDASGNDVTTGATWKLTDNPDSITLEDNKIIIDGSKTSSGSFTLKGANGEVEAEVNIKLYDERYFENFNDTDSSTIYAGIGMYSPTGTSVTTTWAAAANNSYAGKVETNGTNKYIVSNNNNGAMYNLNACKYTSIKQLTVDYDVLVPTGSSSGVLMFKENTTGVPGFKMMTNGEIDARGKDGDYAYTYETELKTGEWENIKISMDYLNLTSKLFLDEKNLTYKKSDNSTGDVITLDLQDKTPSGLILRGSFDNLAIYSGTYVPPEKGSIDGNDTLTITEQEQSYTFKNAAGTDVDASDVVWSIENAPHEGVTIGGGTLSVSAEAAEFLTGGEKFTIVAESASAYVKATKEISFVGMDIGTIAGEANLLSPPQGIKSELYYTLEGTDDKPVTESVVWSLTDAPAGISIEKETGRLILDGSETKAAGTFKVKAKSATVNVAAELEVELLDKYIYEDFETPSYDGSGNVTALTKNIASNEDYIASGKTASQEFNTSTRGTLGTETNGNTYIKPTNVFATKLEWVIKPADYKTTTLSVKIKGDEIIEGDGNVGAIRDNVSPYAFNLQTNSGLVEYKPTGGSEYVSTGVKVNPTGWTEFRIELDYGNKKYNVYVDDTLAIKEASMDASSTPLNGVFIEHAVDDFALYSGNKVVEDGVWVDGTENESGTATLSNSTIKVIASGKAATGENLVIALAHYADNQLKAVKYIPVQVFGGEYRTACTLEGVTGGSVKGFLWNKSTLKPLGEIICGINN